MLPAADRVAMRAGRVPPSIPLSPRAPAAPSRPPSPRAPTAPSRPPSPTAPSRPPAPRAPAAKAPALPPAQPPAAKAPALPPAQPPAAKAPSMPVMGGKKRISCPDGTSATCSAGTRYCADNSPFFCKAPAPARQEIACSRGTSFCAMGDPACIDYSPQFCPTDTEAVDAWRGPPPRREVPMPVLKPTPAAPPYACISTACAGLGVADMATCLCYAGSGEAAAQACAAVGSNTSAAQAIGLGARNVCLSLM